MNETPETILVGHVGPCSIFLPLHPRLLAPLFGDIGRGALSPGPGYTQLDDAACQEPRCLSWEEADLV
jgi:hypothetical protein